MTITSQALSAVRGGGLGVMQQPGSGANAEGPRMPLGPLARDSLPVQITSPQMLCACQKKMRQAFHPAFLNCSGPSCSDTLKYKGGEISEMWNNLKKLDLVCPRLRIALN